MGGEPLGGWAGGWVVPSWVGGPVSPHDPLAHNERLVTVLKNQRRTGVTGPDNDQDQTTTTPFGHCVVLKFQDQTTTT